MRKLKICIIGYPDKYETTRLYNEITLLGHSCDIINFQEIELSVIHENTAAVYHNKDLKSYDIAIIRIESHLIPYITQILTPHTFVYESYPDKPFPNKFNQYIKLTKAKLRVPNTYFIGKYNNIREKLLEKNVSQFSYPVIVKEINRNKGEWVFLAEKYNMLVDILRKYPSREFVVQEFIGNREDLRIIVLGDKVLGAIKKIAPDNDFRTNVSQNGKTEQYELDTSLAELALQASKSSGIEFAGIDIMFHNEIPYILEVNNTPQFKGFEETTNINIAKVLANFIIDKYLTVHKESSKIV